MSGVWCTIDGVNSHDNNNCMESMFLEQRTLVTMMVYFQDNGLSDNWAFALMGHFFDYWVFGIMGRRNNGAAPK